MESDLHFQEFTNNEAAIDCLKLTTFSSKDPNQIESYMQTPGSMPIVKRVVMFALVSGELSYYEFQGIQKIDNL